MVVRRDVCEGTRTRRPRAAVECHSRPTGRCGFDARPKGTWPNSLCQHRWKESFKLKTTALFNLCGVGGVAIHSTANPSKCPRSTTNFVKSFTPMENFVHGVA